MFFISIECVILCHSGLSGTFKIRKKLIVGSKRYHPIEFFLSKILVFRKVSGLFCSCFFQGGRAEMFILSKKEIEKQSN